MGRFRVVCATSVPNDKRRLLLRRSICLDRRTDVGQSAPPSFVAAMAELAQKAALPAGQGDESCGPGADLDGSAAIFWLFRVLDDLVGKHQP